MTASQIRQQVFATITDVDIARLSIYSAMQRITDNISAIKGIDSNSPDVALAVQGLTKIEALLLESLDEIDVTRQDLSNYSMVIT